jgi:60kDa lysophospholipase
VTASPRSLGDGLCAAASRGRLKKLESYRLAGVDLNICDVSGRTGKKNFKKLWFKKKIVTIYSLFIALHLASLQNHMPVVEYLINLGVELMKDLLGLTAIDYAIKMEHLDIVEKLKNHFSSQL